MYKRLLATATLLVMCVLATPLRAYAACGGALQPACPTAPTLTGTAGVQQNSLSWTSVSTASYYNLKRGSSIIYSGGTTLFTETGLTAGTAYSYAVSACNSDGCSPNSISVNLTPTAPTTTSPATYPIPAFSDHSQITYRDINLIAIYITGVIILILVSGFKWRGND